MGAGPVCSMALHRRSAMFCNSTKTDLHEVYKRSWSGMFSMCKPFAQLSSSMTGRLSETLSMPSHRVHIWDPDKYFFLFGLHMCP